MPKRAELEQVSAAENELASKMGRLMLVELFDRLSRAKAQNLPQDQNS